MSRDFLAGVAAMYSTPFYKVIPGKFKLAWPSFILSIIGLCVAVPVYLFYWHGPAIRARSKFAMTLAADGLAAGADRKMSVASHGGQRGKTLRSRSIAPPGALLPDEKQEEKV